MTYSNHSVDNSPETIVYEALSGYNVKQVLEITARTRVGVGGSDHHILVIVQVFVLLLKSFDHLI